MYPGYADTFVQQAKLTVGAFTDDGTNDLVPGCDGQDGWWCTPLDLIQFSVANTTGVHTHKEFRRAG